MQSSNFVEGVSGWRIADGRIELYGGLAPIILEKTPEPGKPSGVVDGRDASEILDMIAGKIRETGLGGSLKGSTADQVREVIRAECRPGGILYRLR